MINQNIEKKVELKAGDILGFELNTERFKFKKEFGFARVLGKTRLGDAIDVYDYFSNDENDYAEAISAPFLFEQPVILDGHSTFWVRTSGNWTLLKEDPYFYFTEYQKEKVKFKYGVKGLLKLVDLNGRNYTDCPQDEAESYPNYCPCTNYMIIQQIHSILKNRGEI